MKLSDDRSTQSGLSNAEQILAALAGVFFLYGLVSSAQTLHSLARDILHSGNDFHGLTFTIFPEATKGIWNINLAFLGVLIGPLLVKRKLWARHLGIALCLWASILSLLSLVSVCRDPYAASDAPYVFIPISLALVWFIIPTLCLTALLWPSIHKLFKKS